MIGWNETYIRHFGGVLGVSMVRTRPFGMRAIMSRAVMVTALTAVSSTGAWAQWESLGPFGGSAAVVQTDAKHPGTVLVATTNAHLLRSRDSGSSWQPVPFPA